MLNLFYDEPDDDRWVPLDRYPRRLIRRVVRGRARPGGQRRVFLNLRDGLTRLGATYRVNDYRYATRNPGTLACIIGKACVLNRLSWRNPILLGTAGHSHPIDDPELLRRLPVRKVLVPGPWMQRMCEPAWGDAVTAWPVGIDTELWRPAGSEDKRVDVLLYDKVRWRHDRLEESLIAPIRSFLNGQGLSFLELRYGAYREEQFHAALSRSRTMIFLCEHETQGLAYQQALSRGVPVFAWDRGGPWQDPAYYPHRVVFEPVTSVPYWDERCGSRFVDAADFVRAWPEFHDGVKASRFHPREYILDNLTLEQSARRYLAFARELSR